jgi:hypothetical protein
VVRVLIQVLALVELALAMVQLLVLVATQPHSVQAAAVVVQPTAATAMAA